MGIRLDTVAITDVFRAYEAQLADLDAVQGLAAENLQARIRGNDLMALSNRFGWLVLATGNKSEYAVGYSTLYGDMAGGFAPIKDVPKTLVYELCAWRNRRRRPTPPIPETVLDEAAVGGTPPRPEGHRLPARRTTSSIRSSPPTSRTTWGSTRSCTRGIGDRATVGRVAAMIDRAEYKRRQAAPGVKITPKAFGRDRRLPITNRYARSIATAPQRL